MANAPANAEIAIVNNFFFDKKPHGFALLPRASRQCADIPSAKKYNKQMAPSLSNEKSTASEPQVAKEITIPVYGKNKIPIPS